MPLPSANDLYNLFGGVGDAIVDARKLALVQQEADRKRRLEDLQMASVGEEAKALRPLFSGGQAGGGGAVPSPTSPSAPLSGDAGAVRDQFLAPIKAAGLTNPAALATVAAYGQHESGFDPAKVNQTWSDRSQSGQPGTSGGILSWRADRLARLQKFAESQGERLGAISPATQGLFFAREDPELFAALQGAKTPEEANGLLANKWRFAGFDQPDGGEYAARLATARSLLPNFQGNLPTSQVAGPGALSTVEPTTKEGRGQALGIPADPATSQAVATSPQAPIRDRNAAVIQAYINSSNPYTQQKGIELAKTYLSKDRAWKPFDAGPAGKGFYLESDPTQRITLPGSASVPEDIKKYEYGQRDPGYAKREIDLKRAGAIRVGEAASERATVADQLGLQGEERKQYIVNGKIPTAAEKDPTEGQSNAALYASRMKAADDVLSSPTSLAAMQSPKDVIASKVPVVGNYAVSSDYQRAEQAQRDFVNAVLRRESGAAISPSEFDNARKQYFPQPGDADEVIAQKARNRQIATEGIRAAAGRALPRVEKRLEQAAPTDWTNVGSGIMIRRKP